MKKAHVFTLALAGTMCLVGLAGCGNKGGGDHDFSFTFSVKGNYESLEVRTEPYELVIETNGVDDSDRVYTYESSDEEVAEVTNRGFVFTKAEGTVRFTVTEEKSNVSVNKVYSVIGGSILATGGYNFSAAATEEQRKTRTEILGKLEKYAMESHLTGISLFENGGYMLYSDRALALLGNRQYITGYGYGLLSDSDAPFTSELPGDGRDTQFPLHYHSASSSDPGSINALNAAGSQVSDLSSYITSSYFGMKLDDEKKEAIWYPMLARDDIHTTDPATKAPKMFHLGAHNDTDMYTGWRIYLRTNISYRYNGSLAGFNSRQVALEDYEFILRFLLTGSHNLKRGNEMAADTSYGIKGANAYNAATKTKTDEECKSLWDSMVQNNKLGVKIGTSDGTESYAEGGSYPAGDYIEFTLINPIDSFTAMYTLSSNLYSPIPEDFMKKIGENRDGSSPDHKLERAAKRYGGFNNNTDVIPEIENNIVSSTLCLGAYYLDVWEKGSRTVFTRNSDWYETKSPYNRYKIEGIRIKIDQSITDNTDAYYDEFKAGNLDACSLPQKHMDEKSSAKQVEGDSVFKLNVNSCTQEQWTERFGPNGSIKAGHNWDVKPWMSNDNFLNGLFWSIDRKSFAEKRGVQPSINYFSGSYMSDPQRNISYNSTEAHKIAVRDFHNVRYDSEGKEIPGTDDYGYNKDTAISFFKAAVAQLIQQGKINYGTVDNPYKMKIEIWWMYQSDITDYGVDIAHYFEEAFNDPSVSGQRIKLEVVNNAVSVWEHVYEHHLQVGEFDLGFGAISGNTYNPLNFLEVLRSDNTSTFTLNWGVDTSLVDEIHPLVYNSRRYSFNALWEVADHGGIVNEGRSVKPVEECYLSTFSTLKKTSGSSTVTLNSKFIDVGDTAEFNVESIAIYVYGGLSFSSDDPDSGVSFNPQTGKITVTKAAQEAIEASIQKANKWDVDSYTGEEKDKDHLTRNCYKLYWSIDFTYSLRINGGQPTLNTITAGKTSSDKLN